MREKIKSSLDKTIQYLDIELKDDTQKYKKDKKILAKDFNKNKLLFVNLE